METITKRYLSRNTAAALDAAHRDGAVAVTERGRAQWTIVAGTMAADPLVDLVEGGLAEPARSPIPWGNDAGNEHAYTGAEIDAIVEDLKGDH